MVDEAVARSTTTVSTGCPWKLAARLGVRQPTLYWHIPSKSALVAAIAETMLEQEFPDWLPVMPASPGGPGSAACAPGSGAPCWPPRRRPVIALAQLSTNMAAFSELAMSTLVARGAPAPCPADRAHRERFTVGFVLEEQTGRPAAEERRFDLESYTRAFPTLVAGVTEYFEPGRTVDDLFADCLALIIEAVPDTSSGVGVGSATPLARCSPWLTCAATSSPSPWP